MTLLRSFFRAIGQFDDPAFRRVLLWGAAAGLFLLCVLVVGFTWAVGAVAETGFAWLDAALSIAGGLAGFILACIMFPAVAGLVVGFLIDDIAGAVEKRHYPHLPEAREQGYLRPMLMALRFLLILGAANLVGLVLAYAIPGVNVIVFVAVNGYLLGREFFDLAALRRVSEGEAAEIRRRHGPLIFATGGGIALLFSIPVVNILAPIVGAAAMVHIFQMLANGE